MTILVEWIIALGYLLNLIVAIIIIFFDRKSPSASLAWIAFLGLIPLVGVILYVIIGQNFRRERLVRIKQEHDEEIHNIIKQQINLLSDATTLGLDPRLKKFRETILLFSRNQRSFLGINNTIRVFSDGNEKFEALFEEIDRAEHHVHLEYYIIRNDELGRKMIERLTAAAARGIQVRLLLDSLGCKIPERNFSGLTEAGGQVAFFFPGIFRINYRNHRKIAVIDGKRGFIGGYNIGNEYLGLSKQFGYWRDSAAVVAGDAVLSLQIRFLMDWHFASSEDFTWERSFFPRDYLNEEMKIPAGSSLMQVVSSGPDSEWESIKQGYLKLINSAERSICIQTPYFVPDDSIMEALRIAALSGVDVRIMIPDHPDHPFVYWVGYSYIGDLLDTGVRAFMYNRGFIHAKTLVVDGEASSVGSANWDIRSFRINFESNVFIYDRAVSSVMEELFDRDIGSCTEITPELYRNRPGIVRFKESLFRLFAPLL